MRKELLNKKESKLKDLEKPQPIHTAKKKKKKRKEKETETKQVRERNCLEEHRKGVAMLPFNEETSTDVSHRANQPSKQKPGALP